MTRHWSVPCLCGVILLIMCGCSTTVQPGQRGLRWYPLTEGLTTETLKSGLYWRAPWNDVFVYDVRWQSYVETVDALSSDDLLVKLPDVGIVYRFDRIVVMSKAAAEEARKEPPAENATPSPPAPAN